MDDVAVPADHRVKLKENENEDKYLDFAKNIWNMKMTVKSKVICVLGTVTQGLIKDW